MFYIILGYSKYRYGLRNLYFLYNCLIRGSKATIIIKIA